MNANCLGRLTGAMRALSLALVGLGVSSASAEVFYWTNTVSTTANQAKQWGDYSDYNNWSVSNSFGDNPNQAIPGKDDFIWSAGRQIGAAFYAGYFDLNGGDYTIAGFSAGTGIYNGWRRHEVAITNGSLTVTNPAYNADPSGVSPTFSHEWIIWDGGKVVMPYNSSAGATIPNGGLDECFAVKTGGQLEFYAKIIPKMSNATVNFLEVDEGGSAIFDPYDGGFSINYQNTGGIRVLNRGSLSLPHGVNWSSTSAVYGTDADRFTLRQIDGTLLIGGDFCRTGYQVQAGTGPVPCEMTFELSGGTLEITNSVKFYSDSTAYNYNASKWGFTEPMVRATMPADAAAAIDVKVDSSCDLTIMTFGDNATLTKRGPGLLKLAALPSALTVEAGVFSVTGAVTSLAGVTFANAAVYCFDKPGAVLAATDLANAANMRFTVADDFPADGVILTSADTDLLRTVVANFDVPTALSEVEPMVFGDSIRLVTRVENAFVSYGEVDLTSSENWKKGVPEGGAAILRGESTVGLIKSTTPAFASIKVEYGAKLKVVDEVELPEVTLETDATLALAEGSWASLSNGLHCVCLPTQLPIVEIATNSTLVVPAPFDFQDVHLNWYGTLWVDGDNTKGSKEKYIGLGTCYVSQKIVYFGMTCIGGTLRHHLSGDWLERIMYAENGGKVEAVGTLLLKDFVHDTGTADNGQWIGYGNASKVPFDLVVDNSYLDVARSQTYGGAARIHLVNGAEICRRGHSDHPGSGIGFYISGDVQIFCESNGGIVFPRSSSPVAVTPTAANTPVFTLGEGGFFDVHAAYGNSKAMLVASNGVLCVDALPYIPGDKQPYPPDGDPRNWVSNSLSCFTSCRIEPGTVLNLASVDRFNMPTQQDRYTLIADVPMTGENGGLVISNGVPGYAFAATLQCGSNTATGRLKVLEADDPTTLYFADGANWSGTVEGNAGVAFTNLTDATLPATVNFAALELTGSMPIRYWRDGEGVITSDTINLAAALTKVGAGCLRPVAMSDKAVRDDVIWLGDYPASAGTPDNSLLYHGWEFVTRPSATDGMVELGCKCAPVAGKVILY